MARAANVVSTAGSDYPTALCSSRTAFSLAGAVFPFVLGGGLAVAALLAAGLRKHLGRLLPAAGAGAVVLPLHAALAEAAENSRIIASHNPSRPFDETIRGIAFPEVEQVTIVTYPFELDTVEP